MKRRTIDIICADSYRRHWYRDANSDELPLCVRCMAPNPRWPLSSCARRVKIATSRHMVLRDFCRKATDRHGKITHEFVTAARSSFLELLAIKAALAMEASLRQETKKRSGR